MKEKELSNQQQEMSKKIPRNNPKTEGGLKMKRLESVMTVRLPQEDLRIIGEISKKQKKDKSTTVRELVELGKIYLAITQYQENKISIGRASEIAGLSISEMMDLLSKAGIKSRLEVEDYLESREFANEIL